MLKSVPAEIDSIREMITAPAKSLTVNQLRQAAEEVEDADRRRLNLIVFGLPEGADDKSELLVIRKR